MTQKKRLIIAGLILLLLVAIVMGVDALQRQQAVSNNNQLPEGLPTAAPGSIPITVNGDLVAAFTPEAIDHLPAASFKDAEEGKTQEGWRLADVLNFYLAEALPADALILVRSNHRDKEATLTWAEVADPANEIMFDLAGRGTLKLVSLLPRLDTRAEWVQDVDEITITVP
ncbi:MAG: hypothetical protein KDE04_10890 [Anaerolineales bacterium]|nr:hypothetical protein [Anaerolineales bacterium]MCB0029640.1 hypothetical protein [Anaerolineales bacterium]